MKKYFVIIAACVAACAVSCKKNELSPVETPEGYNQFVASMGDEVKTTLDATTGSVAWAEGDAIKILWKEDDALKTAVSLPLTAAGAAASPAVFMADCTPSGDTFALYPSSLNAEKPGYLVVELPTVQNGKFSDVQVLAAKYLDGKFTFQNVCGFLQFSVPAGVTKVVWSSDCVTFPAGKINVGFPNGIHTDGIVDGTGENEIIVNVDGAGTYYAAVAPGKYASLYVAMFNGDTLVGEKQTFNEVDVARAQVKRMGTLPETPLAGDKYYVKVAGSGSKDGSSWDNAADLAAFKTLIASTDANGKTFYLAAGTYDAGAQISVAQTTTFKIYGGFPADATGTSLVGRDTRRNETVFTGNDAHRIFVIQKATVTYDGLVFEHAFRDGTTSDAGTALVMQGCGDQTINNCVFRDNHTPYQGGVLRVVPTAANTVTITNCLFENNSSKLDGGVLCMTQGHLISKNNIYRHNITTEPWASSAEHGGGVVFVKDVAAAGTTLYFEGDLFDGNRAMADWSKNPSNGASGSVMYLKNVKTGCSVDMKCNRCVFINNRAKTRGCVRVANLTTASKVMLNACTFARDSVAEYGSALHTQNQALVHNCVFYQNINSSATGAAQIYYDANVCISNTSIRLGGNSSVGIREAGGVNSVIVNNLIYNWMKGSAIVVASGKTLTSYGHNIYNNSGAADASPVVDAVGTFTVQDPTNHADAIYTIDPTWKSAPSYLLEWNAWPNGTAPENFSLCTPARVEEAIDAYDAAATSVGAKAWLNEIGALNADCRGTARSTTAIWPGSYDNSATTSLQ